MAAGQSESERTLQMCSVAFREQNNLDTFKSEGVGMYDHASGARRRSNKLTTVKKNLSFQPSSSAGKGRNCGPEDDGRAVRNRD